MKLQNSSHSVIRTALIQGTFFHLDQSRADLAEGHFVKESPEAHVARLKASKGIFHSF